MNKFVSRIVALEVGVLGRYERAQLYADLMTITLLRGLEPQYQEEAAEFHGNGIIYLDFDGKYHVETE